MNRLVLLKLFLFIILTITPSILYSSNSINKNRIPYRQMYNLILNDTSSINYIQNNKTENRYFIIVNDSLNKFNTLDGYKYLEKYCSVSLNKLLCLMSNENISELDSLFKYKNCDNSDSTELTFAKLPTKKEHGIDVFALTFSEEYNNIVIATLVYMAPLSMFLDPNNKENLDYDYSCHYGRSLKYIILIKNNCVYKIFSIL